MKKICLISLGCVKNVVDSEMMLGLFKTSNYMLTNNKYEADIIVINTCGFINDAKEESINVIFDTLKTGAKIVVTGCLATRYLDELKETIPEVSKFIPLEKYDSFIKELEDIDDDLSSDEKLTFNNRVLSTQHFSAYLKIADGCSNNCSYCAIPLIRGPIKSRHLNDIIEEANILKTKGVKELVILAQDTTKYGIDLSEDVNIVDVLKELLKIEQFEYIRLLYLYPDEITDELIDLIATEPRLTPYFDIPIQHSETNILKSMNRRGDKHLLTQLFDKIKTKVPNVVLRTTVMVGFPGETSEDFDNLLDFINYVKFDHLGCFKYSPEEDTPSFNFANQVDEQIKQHRLDTLMKIQRKISYNKTRNRVGEVMEGLIIGKENQHYLLRSYFNAPDDIDGKVFVKTNEKHNVGDKIKVKVTDAFVYDLLTEEVK